MERLIIGIDEVGRGSLCGPVVVAATVFPQDVTIKGVRDSKKVQPYRRADLSPVIKEQALHWVMTQSSSEQVDKFGIHRCIMAGMVVCARRCLDRFPDALVVVDGAQGIDEIRPGQQRAIVSADDKVFAVSAASIIAKVYRDRYMCVLGALYPLYELHRNNGYGSKVHMTQLRKHGPCPEHRRSFEPLKGMLNWRRA